MHDDNTAVGGGADGFHFRVCSEAGDVVNDICSSGQRGGGDGGFRGIDRYVAVPFGT